MARTIPFLSIRNSPAQGDAAVEQHAVVGADLLGQVGHERVLEPAEAALLARCLDPGQVAELAVDRAAEHLGAALAELLDPVAEGDDLGRADEGEVERVEEQDDVLAAVVGQLDLS